MDFVAFRDDPSAEEGVDIIAMEAQAIDLRGGSVGPAWRAWRENNAEQWRAYFTEEARRKDRRDAIDYGVNTGNVYKRLGTQITVKGEFFKQVHVPFYVVTQHRILQQLRERVNFDPVTEGAPWDITFVSFDYDGTHEPDGRLAFRFVEAVRTTLASYIQAMTAATGLLRSDFINRVRLKARMHN
ncbi:MAG TPA: hypothetical protein VFM55_06115 [Micromonosporaceae bacterium]|nr:hypothetical protein [Micromonosporaceae bacterium]